MLSRTSRTQGWQAVFLGYDHECSGSCSSRYRHAGYGHRHGRWCALQDKLLAADFTLAARTGVGKTVLGVYAAVNLAYGGLKIGLTAELDKHAIYARIWAAATYVHTKGSYDYVNNEQRQNTRRGWRD